MKRVTVPMLCLVLFLTACQKTELTALKEASTLVTTAHAVPIASTNEAGNAGNSQVTITGWERSDAWLQEAAGKDNRQHLVRAFPQVTKDFLANGTVLVFAKGYNFSNAKTPMPALGMPFCFYQPFGQENIPVFFEYSKQAGAIRVSMKTQPEATSLVETGRAHLQFRYFVLSQQELEQHGLTPEKAHNMGYKKLVALYGLQP